jgi:hypothetical protein
LGGLTLGQWTQLVVCGLAADALSALLPLPGSWSVSVAVTVCGLPAACAVVFMSADVDVLQLARSALRWKRSPTWYAGAADAADPVDDEVCLAVGARGIGFDAESLWD